MTLSEPLTGPLGPRATAAGPGRQWRREALSALGDDPRRRPPVVDGYEVGRLLGAGGSSVVWAGTGADGVDRALKVLAVAGDAPGPDLLRELTLLRRVRHPRVVAVHDISTDERGRPVLVLDLAAGGSLAGVLAQRRRLSAGEVSGLLHALGPALEDLHAADVVHGDVAPGNVLLDARGEPLLADLGVSRALGRRHGSVLGTPGFADPAALAGEGVGAAADVYGLAALGWCALTGEPPTAVGPLGARQAQRRAAADLPAGASVAVLAALREGLHRKPSRRPTPGELATAVAAAARPRPVRGLAVPRAAAAPPPGAEPPPGVTRRLGGGVAGGAGPVVDLRDEPVEPVVPPGTSGPVVPGGPGGSVGDTGSRPAPERLRPRSRPGRRPQPRRERGGSRRPARPARSRRLLLVAATLPVVCGGALVLALHSPAAEPAGKVVSDTPAASAPTVAPPATPVAPDAEAWGGGPATGDEAVLTGDDAAAVVAVLAARRAAALTAGTPDALDAVDVAGSAARAADEALLADLTARGATFDGLAFHVEAVREVTRAPDRWVLEADVTTGAHVVVGADGSRSSVPAGQPRTSRLTLDRVEGQWRVGAVG
ncbi:serine/threonine-protein kinase [Kineococcus sp. NPDC059986]|uniref:serine/threonine-protein kinase n=1 Tax=Kineococcus sp. NPDC059986 TaxID=3155538 RepID=UPI00344D7B64